MASPQDHDSVFIRLAFLLILIETFAPNLEHFLAYKENEARDRTTIYFVKEFRSLEDISKQGGRHFFVFIKMISFGNLELSNHHGSSDFSQVLRESNPESTFIGIVHHITLALWSADDIESTGQQQDWIPICLPVSHLRHIRKGIRDRRTKSAYRIMMPVTQARGLRLFMSRDGYRVNSKEGLHHLVREIVDNQLMRPAIYSHIQVYWARWSGLLLSMMGGIPVDIQEKQVVLLLRLVLQSFTLRKVLCGGYKVPGGLTSGVFSIMLFHSVRCLFTKTKDSLPRILSWSCRRDLEVMEMLIELNNGSLTPDQNLCFETTTLILITNKRIQELIF